MMPDLIRGGLNPEMTCLKTIQRTANLPDCLVKWLDIKYLYHNFRDFTFSAVLPFLITLSFPLIGHAENGYRLWMRYDLVTDEAYRQDVAQQIGFAWFQGGSEVLEAARREFRLGINGMIGNDAVVEQIPLQGDGLIAGVRGSSSSFDQLIRDLPLDKLKAEGFILASRMVQGRRLFILAASDEKGVLYGTFNLLQRIQQHLPVGKTDVIENPKLKLRLLNHWDNLDRTVERGYAGFSIWNWHTLPGYLDPRYSDYARANASIGINGTVVTNVNANAWVLRPDFLEKVTALANIFRPYGIQIYLTARFSAPMELGGLSTADPLDPAVRKWWQDKVEEIYKVIPDFGGFLVKANSEGQPGPHDYHRTHADGANMLAEALAPHGGVVMWRAFVYTDEQDADRAMQAYDEFKPLDGKFKPNVLIQVKNGPIDFQPREPIHPLFGAMAQTPVMMEFQITKEYLGQATQLVSLAGMYEEVLQTDTYRHGKGSTVAKCIEGDYIENTLTGMAGVSNIGTDINWTGHPFGQADWFAYGRLAWDPERHAQDLYREWVSLTYTTEQAIVNAMVSIMDQSREACVQYMTPLGLHHMMATEHHYGPGPWVDDLKRADWNPVYYHRADTTGIGFNRTTSGSNALSQYAPGFQKQYEDPDHCPLDFLLWFHHVAWKKVLPTGRTLWDELCWQYEHGVATAKKMSDQWSALEDKIDPDRYRHVRMLMGIQVAEATWWHDACLAYFQTFSRLPFPPGTTPPAHPLAYYQSLKFPFAPGIRPTW